MGFSAGNTAGEFHHGVAGTSNADMMNLGSDVGEFDNNEMTYSMWFKTTNNDTDMRMLVNHPSATDHFMLVMHQGKMNVLTATNASSSLGTAGTAYNDGQWHHVLAVRNGDNISDAELWMDGVDVSNTLSYITWFSKAGNHALIGSRGLDSQPHRLAFDGTIDEVTIWDRALTNPEIALISNSAVAKPAIEPHGYAQTVLDLAPEAHYRMEETGVSADTVLKNETGDTSRDGVWGYSSTYPTSAPVAGVAGPRPTDRLGGTGPYLRGFESGNKAGDFHFGDDPDRADMMNLGSDVGEFDNNEMTYSMWFKTDNDRGNMRMLVNGSASSNPFLLVMHAGQLNVLTATGAAYSLGTKGVTYDDDYWHHVVAVRNGDVVADAELWIDGVDVSNTLQYISWFSMPASSALIGARDIGDYNNSFAGAIDEVSVWDRALTPDEIRGLFFAAITAVPEPASILLLGLGGLGLLCSLRLRRRLS